MIIHPTFEYELECVARGLPLIGGVDEVGRGPLAGPVIAAAVILPEEWFTWTRGLQPRNRASKPVAASDLREWIRDSKQLSAARRNTVSTFIIEAAVSFSVAVSTVETIDARGIVYATRQAMSQAVAGLNPQPNAILVDALDLREPGILCKPIVHGDALCISIAAASIVAKVHRDRLMEEIDKEFPGYGLAQNKGYATRNHLRAIQELGPTPMHRRSFSPIKEILLEPRLF